ncbi:secreted frizzled-related protein 1 isoform X2 [Leopardus geoffroyi]|uniref:secreted frizzled-related protein 1 isoform X2 n=1 Tax=Felis catus TaxID=9685 RepID=UPI0009485168|nr:secreted frizzled-related protein 1 isoform X2 [Felis catus]XP_040308071.1 secreted frizzled-related protein 1 isoform X2 [Puma yagouaroundi]XP_045315608.1 secreted frizzled-related protein 1 isoform X2 [Leopardus geoffroyi]
MGSGRGAGGRRWAAPGVLLALAAGLLAAGSASEYDYVSFQSDIGSYQSGRFYTKPPQCVDIPVDLRLCHNVGYKKMVLPNLLEHETMAEVKQQASSWVPLLNKNCHIGTQVFLCSLFAPVCLDRPIYPCRWLCEAVRDSCEPVMQFFGFYWPEMLKCDKFPEGDVCIAMTPPNATEASKPQGTTVCPPCDNELKSEAIIEHLCASEFGAELSSALLSILENAALLRNLFLSSVHFNAEDENKRSEKRKWRQKDCPQEEEASEAGTHQEEGTEEACPIPEEWG